MDRVRAAQRRASGITSAFALLAFLTGCSGGGSGSGGTGNATLSFAVTDAAQDDIESFIVQITNVELTKLGNTQVDILDTTATVDLASLTDASQLISGLSVEAGTYIAASVTIDFTNAQCFLAGNATEASILDETGAPLAGPVTLPISFGQGLLLAQANRHKLLELDFDMNQSCTTDTVANTISIDPAFVLRVDPVFPKPLLLVGTVTSVDAPMQRIQGQLRTLGGTAITPVALTCTGTTVFQIDGVPYVGTNGLTALAGVPMPDVTWFEALGTINPITQAIIVSVVYAGHGTFNGGDDIVEGHIVDRAGAPGADATLTVRGHSNESNHTVFQFNQTFTVAASFANTKIVRAGGDQAFDTDDLNVGQRVRIFGSMTGTNLDASTTTSVVRMKPTNVFGIANGPVAAGDLEIDLASVDFRPEADFTWASSGTPATDPDQFLALVGNLGNGQGIVATTPVVANGFFPPVTDTLQDFQANALLNLEFANSLMFVRNRPNGLVVDATPLGSSISLQISGVAVAGEVAVIDRPLLGPAPLPTSPDPVIGAPSSGPRFYVLRDKTLGTTTVYVVFSQFSNALAQKLGVGAEIDQFAAIGIYSSANNAIAASLASAVVH